MDVIVSQFTSSEQTCKNTECLPFASTDSSEQGGDENGCTGKTCNPFHLCTSGVVLVNDIMMLETSDNQAYFAKVLFNYQSSSSSLYISDFWHPPKFV